MIQSYGKYFEKINDHLNKQLGYSIGHQSGLEVDRYINILEYDTDFDSDDDIDIDNDSLLSRIEDLEDEIKRLKIIVYSYAINKIYFDFSGEMIPARKRFIDKDTKINLYFHVNYLGNDHIKQLVKYILMNDKLKKSLVSITLYSNRFDKSVLPDLDKLIENCPKLKRIVTGITLIQRDIYEYYGEDKTKPSYYVAAIKPY